MSPQANHAFGRSSRDINIIPERFNKTYFHWIDNLRDWCISARFGGVQSAGCITARNEEAMKATGSESRITNHELRIRFSPAFNQVPKLR